MTDKMALMHLMSVVDGEDTKRVLVYLICPKDSEDENYTEFETIFFSFTIPLYLSEKDYLHEQKFLSIFGPHTPWKVLQKNTQS